MHMEYYSQADLQLIVERSANIFDVGIESQGALEISRRSRGTPRVANRILRRVRDFAQVKHDGVITQAVTQEALKLLEIDDKGLDQTDRKLLKAMIDLYQGGPVGLNTIAVNISEDIGTVEDMYEPYLLQIGFLQRTPRGRVVTRQAYDHLKIEFEKEEDD